MVLGPAAAHHSNGRSTHSSDVNRDGLISRLDTNHTCMVCETSLGGGIEPSSAIRFCNNLPISRNFILGLTAFEDSANCLVELNELETLRSRPVDLQRASALFFYQPQSQQFLKILADHRVVEVCTEHKVSLQAPFLCNCENGRDYPQAVPVSGLGLFFYLNQGFRSPSPSSTENSPVLRLKKMNQRSFISSQGYSWRFS